MSSQKAAIISVVTFEALIGLSPVIYKLLSTGIPGAAVISIRWGLGAVVLLLWLLLKGDSGVWKKTYTIKQIAGILFLGILGSGIASLLNLIAVRNIGVVLASLLTNLELPLGVLLGVVILGEKLTPVYLKAAGIITLGFFLLTVKNGIVLPAGGSYVVGVGLALIAAVIWGASTLVGKKLTSSHTPSMVALWRLALGAVTNVVLIGVSGQSLWSVYQTISLYDWPYLMFLGVVTSGVGFVLYYKALAILSIHKITLLFTISPVVSVVAGVALGETPLVTQWIGIGCILLGFLYLFWKKEHA